MPATLSTPRSAKSDRSTTRASLKFERPQEAVKFVPGIRERLSETSSDFTLALSKQDSTDIIGDDTGTRPTQAQRVPTRSSDGEDESRSASVSQSTEHFEIPGAYKLDSESCEAYRSAKKQMEMKHLGFLSMATEITGLHSANIVRLSQVKSSIDDAHVPPILLNPWKERWNLLKPCVVLCTSKFHG